MFANRYAPLESNNKQIINKRSDAFKILSDKSMLKSTLYKTSMCNKEICNNKHCTYAHSLSELKVRKCLFGDDCIYKDSSNKMCKYIHPGENKQGYMTRLNNSKIKRITL
jgi:hypothetical protein